MDAYDLLEEAFDSTPKAGVDIPGPTDPSSETNGHTKEGLEESSRSRDSKRSRSPNRDRKDRDRDRSDRDRRDRDRSPRRDRSDRSDRDRRDRDRSPRRERSDRDRRDRERSDRDRSPRRDRSDRERSPRRERSPTLTQEERDARTVLVRQLPRDCVPQDLQDFFTEKAGPVREVRMISDRNSSRGKGIAYVEFIDVETHVKALTLNGERLKKAPLIIQATMAEKNYQAALKAKEALVPARISIANLPFSVDRATLEQLFSPFGEVAEAAIFPDPLGRGSSGQGFVTFKKPEVAAIAVGAMNNASVLDRQIRVTMAGPDIGPSWGAPSIGALAPLPAGGMHPNLDGAADAGVHLSANGRVDLMAKLNRGVALAPPVVDATAGFINPARAAAMGLPILPPPGAATANAVMPMMPMMTMTMVPSHPALAARPLIPMLPLPQVPTISSAPGVPIVLGSPSTMFMLRNMFDPDTETEPDWEDDIRDEVLEECSKYGPVVHIAVDANSKGLVYVKFQSIDGAVKAQKVMHGRFFAAKMITVEYLTDAAYTLLFPQAAGATKVLTVD